MASEKNDSIEDEERVFFKKIEENFDKKMKEVSEKYGIELENNKNKSRIGF
jgi:hypothetical protein